ncbi:Fic family protein [Legionella cincinnatiensis]|uniref:Filamentation induced by cAMP protein Fic n=1 Tax=Legionella cincinnatiensis TaxID=28085 RepID=A0A378IKX6_9GAMM|nr:Fic family protein [Legionella cincinnatiensis]KTC88584.1 Filamentation induced by cAMP protein Fic [Legionella cincinnatiensis]STX35927.1 Filamentation induced by cAMP protein Fic [Legionella cincinnatiensis]
MKWNWQLGNWPNFTWDSNKLVEYEQSFTENAGIIIGSSQHISQEGKQNLFIDLMCTDALDSSEIEGEHLNRDSVQSSIKKELGLSTEAPRASMAERGIAKMMVNLYQTISSPLTHQVLFEWHQFLMGNSHHLEHIGQYRKHEEAMQIVSGPDYDRKIHFEAPPSTCVPDEMDQFLNWFERSSLTGSAPLPTLTRAGIAHLWFESIHPFEDGNGRIGRAIAEKALSQGFSKPVMTVLAKILLKKRKEYYQQLGLASKTLDLTSWLIWFANIALEAQQSTYLYIDFIIKKSVILREAEGKINPRQEKVLLRLFHAGPDGFVGGLSAKNYMSITGAPIATTTRDLNDLVKKNILKRTGELKATRYFLNLDKV